MNVIGVGAEDRIDVHIFGHLEWTRLEEVHDDHARRFLANLDPTGA